MKGQKSAGGPSRPKVMSDIPNNPPREEPAAGKASGGGRKDDQVKALISGGKVKDTKQQKWKCWKGSKDKDKKKNKKDTKDRKYNKDKDKCEEYKRGYKGDKDRKYIKLPHNNPKTWESIRKHLLHTINTKSLITSTSIIQFMESVLKTKCPDDLCILKLLLDKIPLEQIEALGTLIFPNIIQYVLNLEIYFPLQLYPKGIKILDKGNNASVYLSKLQVAVLLSSSFLCFFDDAKYPNLPRLNMTSLFSKPKEDRKYGVKTEKLRALLFGYFGFLAHNGGPADHKGYIYISRMNNLGLDIGQELSKSKLNFQDVVFVEEGIMEDYAESAVIVDFASKYLGGGVLGSGGVQEEIMFINHPELIAASFVCESMRDEEAIYIEGATRYTTNSGYADTFQYITQSETNPQISIIAIDALYFSPHNEKSQFTADSINRELRKAVAGFQCKESTNTPLPICTGRWGCGAFHGDPQLKFIIQWVAASYAGRQMIFFSAGDPALEWVKEVCGKLKWCTVQEVYFSLLAYGRGVMAGGGEGGLFGYLLG